ncbi:hypothetical protein DH17_11900 [Acinetobacter oleivorans]|jgi:PBP1b-binding outer membrane lipoprotein LpoB|uniref:Uncharacterized protein n=2 Tax=Acinetobacter TaxID=469 RepID=A0A0B2U8P7_9GAMM|nr:hypothetical protein DH17_11900 [Acinetobacter oleivorans]
MKRYIFLGLVMSLLSACSNVELNPDQVSKQAQEQQLVQVTTIESKKDSYCSPDEAKKLIGQSVPSEAELKKITNAGFVRISRKGQSVRANLVYNHLSVVIDDDSKIIHSNCSLR